MTSAHSRKSSLYTITQIPRLLIGAATVYAACYAVLANSLPERDSSGKPLSEHNITANATSRRHLLGEASCSNSTWLCSTTLDLQHRVSDALLTAINGGQCVRVSATLRLWRCKTSLVPDDVKQMVLNGSCTAECNPPTQRCAAPAFAPAPAPSADAYALHYRP